MCVCVSLSLSVSLILSVCLSVCLSLSLSLSATLSSGRARQAQGNSVQFSSSVGLFIPRGQDYIHDYR